MSDKRIVIKLEHPFEYSWLDDTIDKYQYLLLMHYPDNDALAVVLSTNPEGLGDSITVVSVNTPDSISLDNDEFAMHSTDLPADFVNLFKQTGIAKPTTKSIHSGFVDFPVWKLMPDIAKKVEAENAQKD